jgi:transposase-like protein
MPSNVPSAPAAMKLTAQTLRINETLLQRWVREARQKDREQAFPGKGRRALADAGATNSLSV